MLRLLTSVAIVLFALAGPVRAGDLYNWSISATDTDPVVNSGALTVGAPDSLYLWLDCSIWDGASAMEADIATEGVVLLSFIPGPGVLNAGAGAALLLALGGCPVAPAVVGTITVLNTGVGGSVCLVPSAANDQFVVVDCDTLNPVAYPAGVVGFATEGDDICRFRGCIIDYVEPRSWSEVKDLYR